MKKIVSGLLIGLIAMTSLTACQVTSQTNYTVTWQNYDGTILEVDNDVPYGSIPSYDGETPRRDVDDQYSYAFSGWSPEVSEVVSNITYIAQFTSSVNLYTVTWQNYDGSILEVDEDVPYGSMPSYDGKTPKKYSYNQYVYTFSGWSPEVSEVVCDVTYIAQFSYEDDLTYTLNSTNDGYVVSKGRRSARYIDIVIPDKHNNLPVTSIAGDAFSNCTSLTSIYIPNSVSSIGGGAFYNCISLTKITIPDSVTYIGNYAFSDCSNLTTVTFGENSQLTSIGDYAFRYCSSLTSITIPDSVTTIGSYAFSGCSNFTSVTFGENSQLTSIGYRAFSDCSLTSITIPDSVTSIGDYAFSHCSNLTSITIPDSVTIIGFYAFEGCSSLTSITIPDSVTSIGGFAFYYCSNLTTVTFGENSQLTSIGDYAFYNCSNLISITIPDSVTSIGDFAFYYCSNLTSITIPDSVTSIGGYAFCGCSNLTIYCEAASEPSGWDSWWNDSDCPVIWNCLNAKTTDDGFVYHVYENEDGTKYIVIEAYIGTAAEVVIPDTISVDGEDVKVTTIAENAFSNNDTITSVTIGNNVTRIGDLAFYNCSNLTIYCEAASKPSGWSSLWNYSDCPVVWGYVG